MLGKKPKGREPKPPQSDPKGKDQVNLTDDESRIKPVSGGGFEQCFNTQASVDTDRMLVMSKHVTQATNDKQQIEPALKNLSALPDKLGKVTDLLADTGYFSANNVGLCTEADIQPLLAVARDHHHQFVFERFAPGTPAPEMDDPLPLMEHRLTTQAGRALYGLRKQTLEPVCGIIKHVMGFRQPSMRGLNSVSGEWPLATLSWNVKRMNVLRMAE